VAGSGRVKVGRRFVEQKERRPGQQHPGQTEALAFACAHGEAGGANARGQALRQAVQPAA
jgi:hypothetical protein